MVEHAINHALCPTNHVTLRKQLVLEIWIYILILQYTSIQDFLFLPENR